MENRKQLIAVVGPTGSGKTALGVHIAKRYNGIIISADSRQVYKRMDIGTNKEGTLGTWQGQTARTVEGVTQLLIDVAEPGNRFTLADWLERAQKSLEIIWAQGQLPVLVGGTGLYVSALLDGYRLGAGRFAKERVPVNFSSLVLMSEVSREQLYQRSDERVERIFDQVSLEVSSLLESGVEKTWLERIGLDYSFALKFQTGALSRDEAIQQCQQASRQYIRRQITWWRHHQNPQLVRSAAAAVEQVAQFLKAPEKAVE